jgi:uncharacterized protein
MAEIAHKSTLTRRRFLQWIGGTALTAGAMAGYIRLVEPRWLSIEHLEIPIPGLSPTLDGKRIAQLSDIHLSRYFSPERLASALQEVERQAPAWLMLTGDFVGNHAEAAAGLVEPLRRLSMPIYAIFGNHDLWTDRATVWRYLQEANATVLLNDAREIESNLWLAGLDDLWSGDPDLSVAMRNVPSGAPTILLEHEPDYFDTVLRENAPITLQLSGHSHGGQVRLPTLKPDVPGLHSYAPILPEFGRRYPIGLRQFKARYVYTNRGLGVWPIPLRFNCPPELTLITLRSA